MELKKGACHTEVEDGECYRDILYTKADLEVYPDRYPGLSPKSSFKAVQAFLHYQNKCPRPCWGTAVGKEMTEDEVQRLGQGALGELQKANAFNASKKEGGRRGGGWMANSTSNETVNATTEANISTSNKIVNATTEANISTSNKTANATTEANISTSSKIANATTEVNTSANSSRGTTKANRSVENSSNMTKIEDHEEHVKREEEGEDKYDDGEDGYEEDCEPVSPDSLCFHNVEWVMKTGIFTHPDWYDGLSQDSTFQEVQAFLSKDPDTQCPKPCDCHTASTGETCYDKVLWVLQVGIVEHPTWYPDLHSNSSHEEVQRVLQQKEPESNCPKPCHTKVTKPLALPSLFCFAVVQPSGDEADLVRAQVRKKVGIFACDDFALFCEEKTTMEGVESISFQPAAVGMSKDGTAGNAELFMNVWEALYSDGRFANHDWTIKADPDTVLLPDRLRASLIKPIYAGATDSTSVGSFVKNCGKWQGLGWPAMFGSLEAISRPAMIAYLDGGLSRCKSELQWQAWGEDLFVASCLSQILGVQGVNDTNLTGDNDCKGTGPTAGPSTGANCSDGQKASYHPFKTEAEWFTCFEQAL